MSCCHTHRLVLSCAEGDIVPLTDVCEDEYDEEWHALAPEEWLECVTTIKATAGIHECPMNVACC